VGCEEKAESRRESKTYTFFLFTIYLGIDEKDKRKKQKKGEPASNFLFHLYVCILEEWTEKKIPRIKMSY
jgi:hypothetical protein